MSDRLRERLADVGISQSELARRVSLTQGTIAGLLRGASQGSKHLHKIARELGTTPAYLAGETDDPDADAPPPPELSHDEAAMLGKWRQLEAEDRKVVESLLDRLIGPRTIHAPKLAYRAGDGG